MLCFGQRKYPFLPFVISLFTYAIFFTPAFHSQSTVPAFRDSPGPHGQLGLLIQLLQFCAHNKKHPRIADSTRESRILSATIREYCVTLSFCTQAAATFDGYAKPALCVSKSVFSCSVLLNIIFYRKAVATLRYHCFRCISIVLCFFHQFMSIV